jgi:hypothetical protein
VMLAMVYLAKWHLGATGTPMPKSLEPYIKELEKESGTTIVADYVPDEGYDYMSIEFSPNFSSRLMPKDQWGYVYTGQEGLAK